MSTIRWLFQSEASAPADASANNYQFTDMTLELPFLGQRQKSTMVGTILFLILLVIHAVVVIISSWLFASFAKLLPAILCSCNVALLVVTGILEKHLAKQVTKDRRQGFLNFSQQLKPFIYLPFKIVSSGTAGMLLIISWCTEVRKLGLPVVTMLRLVSLVVIFWTGAILVLYLWRVHCHNLSQQHPDAIYSLYSAVQPPGSLDDLRYLDGGKLAEQQALLLHYQQDNLRYLSEEILRLQESLSKYECLEDGNAPQLDVVHLLGSREQELRAVMAERDQLQSELRLARRLIAERDSDAIRIRNVNDKYVEENGRLRAMLDEWSARTAKMERVLEAERLSNAELHMKISALRHFNTDSM